MCTYVPNANSCLCIFTWMRITITIFELMLTAHVIIHTALVCRLTMLMVLLVGPVVCIVVMAV